MTKEEKIAKLRVAIEGAGQLKDHVTSTESPAFKEWCRDTDVAIGYVFGADSRHAQELRNIVYVPPQYAYGVGWDQRPVDVEAEGAQALVRGLDEACAVLHSMVKEIEEYLPDGEQSRATAAAPGVLPCYTGTRDVFIIHGHDEAFKQSVARFLEKLTLNPIILHEQPNEGKTIIEKFETRSAPVGYAVALLTPDDIGYRSGHEDEARPRARQNVLLELGYFIAALGRKHVCALSRGAVEIPSDYSGVAYIQADGADWRLELVRELKAAGFDVDANLAV